MVTECHNDRLYVNGCAELNFFPSEGAQTQGKSTSGTPWPKRKEFVLNLLRLPLKALPSESMYKGSI